MILYGIKNCNTVKKARTWLEEHNIVYQYHDVRVDGLSSDCLHDFMTRADWQTLLNRSSSSWRQLTLEQQSDLTQDKAIALILAKPTLLKRPVLDTGDTLLIGFKIQNYQQRLL